MVESQDRSSTSTVQDAIDNIDELIAQGEFEEAEEAIDEAIEAYGSTEELLVLRAEVALESEEYAECVVAVKDALGQVESDEIYGQLLAIVGYAHFYLDELEEARKSFNDAVKRAGAFWSALVGRAMVHEELLYFQAALLDLERAIELDDQEAQPFAIRGSIHLRQGELEAAERDFGHALAMDPYDEESRLNLARLQATARKTSASIETLEPLLDEGVDEEFMVPAALLRSQLSLAMGSTDAALEDAQQAIDAAPDKPWGYLQLAASHLTAMEPGEAIAAIKQAEGLVDDVRDLPDALALRAVAYDQLDKPEKAAQLRDEAEGTARLPGIVYGEWLNPAQNVPLNPNKPLDVRSLLTQLFGDPSLAPEGYEEAVRKVVDQIPQMIEANPGVGQIRIELPRFEGMEGPPQSLVVQVNPGGKKPTGSKD